MNSLYSNKKTDKHKSLFIVVLMLVVLCSCLLVGTIAAWLKRDYVHTDEDNLIGSVDMKVFNNGTEVTGTVTEIDGVNRWVSDAPCVIGGGTNARTPNLTIRNMGTIDALVRVTLKLYYIDDFDSVFTDTDKRPVIITTETPTTKGLVQMTTTNWVYDFPGNSVVAGYMYYSEKLAPYIKREPNNFNTQIIETTMPANNISLINSFIVSDAQKNTVFYIDVTVDAVAYDGNIYKKIENNETTIDDIPVHALPFGKKESLPADWHAWE